MKIGRCRLLANETPEVKPQGFSFCLGGHEQRPQPADEPGEILRTEDADNKTLQNLLTSTLGCAMIRMPIKLVITVEVTG